MIISKENTQSLTGKSHNAILFIHKFIQEELKNGNILWDEEIKLSMFKIKHHLKAAPFIIELPMSPRNDGEYNAEAILRNLTDKGNGFFTKQGDTLIVNEKFKDYIFMYER